MPERDASGGRRGEEQYRQRLDLAVEVSKQAGRLLMERFDQLRDVRKKGRIDIVTDADEAAEAFILHQLRAGFPGDAVLAEESGGDLGIAGASGIWIVDPLDGTVNYAHGVPHFSCSIAFVRDGRVTAGVVHDPVLEETYTALRGGGAWLNGTPVTVSAPGGLEDALLCSGFAYDVRTRPDNNLDHWGRFIMRAQAVRRTGSAALNLAYVAAGRFDGFWEPGIKPWDMAAGALLVAEAGGRVTDLLGGPWDPFGSEIVAAEPGLHQKMLEVLAG